MQGNLNEIDISSILQLIELGQGTGLLFVENHSNGLRNKHLLSSLDRNCSRQSWFIFFLNGQIIYAADSNSSFSRVNDYLRHYQQKKRLNENLLASLSSFSVAEYAYLWALMEHNIIDPHIGRSIIHSLVNETLFDLLSLQQGSFIFDSSSLLTPQLTSLEVAPLISKVFKQRQDWKQLYPYIQSPEQIPLLADIVKLRSALPTATVNKLQHWADGKTSLRQLARYLNRDILTVAKAIYPYVEQGWLKLVFSDTSKSYRISKPDLEVNRKTRIVCIDETQSICETVESVLKPQGYEAICCTNSLEALSIIFKHQPDLILCDLALPQLDGCEICAMLRHSTAFRFIPIIMLTANDKFSERLRAKIAGATDYLTKPFLDTELLILVEKYVNCSIAYPNQGNTTLVDSIKDGVKNVIAELANPK
jgi:twitching motility two-component system response regulator PilG